MLKQQEIINTDASMALMNDTARIVIALSKILDIKSVSIQN